MLLCHFVDWCLNGVQRKRADAEGQEDRFMCALFRPHEALLFSDLSEPQDLWKIIEAIVQHVPVSLLDSLMFRLRSQIKWCRVFVQTNAWHSVCHSSRGLVPHSLSLVLHYCPVLVPSSLYKNWCTNYTESSAGSVCSCLKFSFLNYGDVLYHIFVATAISVLVCHCTNYCWCSNYGLCLCKTLAAKSWWFSL